ncbi:MAG: hypothetical protein JXR07_09420 [Reichenbachiella sp.]
MTKYKFYIVIVILLCGTLRVAAQSDGNYDYTKEFVWGVNKNTNGGLIGGFIFKWSKALDEKKFRTIGFEVMNVKHPKEHQVSNGQGQFIFGKSNYLYAIRSQYGRDIILFKKAPQKGVQINFAYAGGLTLGVIAPYYVKDGEDQKNYPYTPEQFPTYTRIIGTGNLFEGLGESDFTVGLNGKASLIFEMGAFKSNVTGFEIGTLMEVYPRAIELMPLEENRAFFISAFITFFYGKRK